MDKDTGIFYFVGPLNTKTIQLYEKLKQYKKFCFKTEAKDEIDQGYQQRGKTVLVFSDPKYAIQFLKNTKWSTLQLKSFLIIETEGFFKPETLKIYESINLKYIPLSKIQDFVKDTENFLSTNYEQDEEVANIEFSVHLKDK